MAISTFDQIRSGVYRPPSEEEATGLLRQNEAIHERVEAAVFKRNLFYVLAAVVFIVGGALTGGALYLTFPWYVALITGVVAAVGTGAAIYKASTIETSQRIDDCALKAFRFEKCRVSGKRNLRSEEAVEAALKQDLRNPDFKIKVRLLNQTHSFTSEDGFVALKQVIYRHFLACSKDHKQAMRRTYKLLDRLHEGAREKIERKLSGQLKDFALSNGVIEHDDPVEFSKSQTEVELFLLEDQEKVRTFSVYKLSKQQEVFGLDSSIHLPVLIEEDYHSRKQKVICQLEDLHLMLAKEITAQEFFSTTVRPQLQSFILSSMPEERVQEALRDAEQTLGRDIGRATIIVNELEYKFEDESVRKTPERSSECVQEIVEHLRAKGYSDRDLVLRLFSVSQAIMGTTRGFFLDNGFFRALDDSGRLVFAIDKSEAGTEEASKVLKIYASGSRRIYRGTFEGPQSEKDFVEHSWSHDIQDREKHEIQRLNVQGKYYFTHGIEKARARIIERVPYAPPE